MSIINHDRPGLSFDSFPAVGKLVGPAELLKARDTFIDHIQSSAVTQAHRGIVPEGNAGHRRHLVAGQEFVTQIL